MISWGCFETAAPKQSWKISRKTYVVEFTLNTNAQIQTTAYYWKAPLQTNFGKCLERKGCSKSSKIPKICPVFSNVYRPAIKQFLMSAKTDSEKNVSISVLVG